MVTRSSAGAAGVATLLLVLAVLVGGGVWAYEHFHHDRSVEAYCAVFYGEGGQIRSEYTGLNSQSDPIDSLGAILSAPSQISGFFQQLENVAPMSIEPDVAILQQAFQQEANDLISDPIGGLLGGLEDSAATNAAANSVNQWTLQNCGPPPGTSSSANG